MATKAKRLTLYRGFPEKGTYTASPFVIKLEFRFRQAGLPYNVEAGSTKSAPRGKIPYVDLSPLQADNAVQAPSLLGDSTFIVQHLLGIGQVPDLNGTLSEEQKLNDLALRALLEDKLYFYHVSRVLASFSPALTTRLDARTMARELLRPERQSPVVHALPNPCACRISRASKHHEHLARPGRGKIEQGGGSGLEDGDLANDR